MPRPSPAILSREAIISVAWRIIDSDGVEGLSMRRLGAELGVRGPSLYHHFASKDEILDGISEEINKQIVLRATAPDWERVITEYAEQLRRLLSAHPNVVQFFALRPVTPCAMRAYDHLANQLVASGWSLGFQREVVLAVENLVLGAALMANTPNLQLTDDQRIKYPMLADLYDGPPPNEPDDGFEVGFAALMEGLRRIFKPRRASQARAPGRRANPDDVKAA